MIPSTRASFRGVPKFPLGGINKAFFVSKSMSYPRKVLATWSKDQEHLLFTFDDGNDPNPEEDYFYYALKSELIGTKPDWVDWHRQLNSKSWFAQVRIQVERMIEEARRENTNHKA